MKIRLDRVVDTPLAIHTDFEIEASELETVDCLGVGEIALRGRLTPTFPNHLLEATLSYEQTLGCTRCLEGFEERVTADLALIVRVRGEKATGSELELAEEDFSELLLAEPEIDLRALVIEQMQLGFPMKPLCRKDCAGLCPRCGADLNREICSCKREVDPRWAALESLQ
jgi:uncharacterized protein